MDALIRQLAANYDARLAEAATDLVANGVLAGGCVALLHVQLDPVWTGLSVRSTGEVWRCQLPHKHEGEHLVVREGEEHRWSS